MDTRFWGPCGWKLLHNIIIHYPDNPNFTIKNNFKIFFESLPFILPCIYCRKSLNEYYLNIPLTYNELSSNLSFNRWLYNIHNKVNDKLRNQQLINYTNPKFEEIYDTYNNHKLCDINNCWNFLYSIGMNYPIKTNNISIKLKYYYYSFFYNLIQIYPIKKKRNKMILYNRIFDLSNYLDSREELLKWLYGIETILNKNCVCYKKRIENTKKYIAGCKGYNDIKPTCRINIDTLESISNNI